MYQAPLSIEGQLPAPLPSYRPLLGLFYRPILEGLWLGALLGGGYGTLFFPLIGTLISAGIGAVAGLGLGALNGIVMVCITLLWPYVPLRRYPYPRVMQIIPTLVTIGLTLMPFILTQEWEGEGIFFVLIPGIIAAVTVCVRSPKAIRAFLEEELNIIRVQEYTAAVAAHAARKQEGTYRYEHR